MVQHGVETTIEKEENSIAPEMVSNFVHFLRKMIIFGPISGAMIFFYKKSKTVMVNPSKIL